jgi:hypothetical protein
MYLNGSEIRKLRDCKFTCIERGEYLTKHCEKNGTNSKEGLK